MGEWLMPNPATLLSDVLDSPAFGVPESQRARLAVALRETGFLVPTAYYVPDAEELFDMYRRLSEVDYLARQNNRSLIRWVMCRETQDALYRKYGQTQTVHTPNLDVFMAGDSEPTTDVMDEMMDEIFTVMTARAERSIPVALETSRLFDMPIRCDPAARRPLFELIPAEERMPEGWRPK